MTKYSAKIDNIVVIFGLYYQRALKNHLVQKPISWALYQTWKEYDAKEKVRKTDRSR